MRPIVPEIWTLKSWDEVPEDQRDNPSTNTWSMIRVWDSEKNGTSGVSSWVRLYKREIDFIKSINPIEFWKWADQKDGTVYFGNDWVTDTVVKWPRILMASSMRLGVFNSVVIDAISDDGDMARVKGIPKLDEYSDISPYMLMRIFDQNGYNACHGLATMMPVFDPAGGFDSSAGGKEIWFKRKWLRELMITDPGPMGGSSEVIVSYRGTDWLGRTKNLNIRPTSTMYNNAIGYLYPGAKVPLLEKRTGPEGIWGKINDTMWIALYLNSTKTYYTNWRP